MKTKPLVKAGSKRRQSVDAANDLRTRSARSVAHLLGDLRSTADKSDTEIDRATYYDALVRHGLLGDIEELAFTDAPDAVFDALDENKNGTLSIAELEKGVLELVEDPESLTKVQELLSLGNDVMRTSMRQMSEKLSGQAARVVDLFKKWDVNHDGTVSRAEFKRAMPLLGLSSHTPAEIQALFATFDPDGSGEITFRELYKMLRHNSELNAPLAKPPAAPPKPVIVVDLDSLRARTKIDMFKMELQHEVLAYTRSRRQAVNNPTIAGLL